MLSLKIEVQVYTFTCCHRDHLLRLFLTKNKGTMCFCPNLICYGVGILTTPLFAHPLFSSDFIISFQNLEGSRYVQYVVNYLAITPTTTDTQLKDFQKFFLT